MFSVYDLKCSSYAVDEVIFLAQTACSSIVALPGFLCIVFVVVVVVASKCLKCWTKKRRKSWSRQLSTAPAIAAEQCCWRESLVNDAVICSDIVCRY